MNLQNVNFHYVMGAEGDMIGSAEKLHYSINYSSILSELIKTAGRICEEYSSDLFILWPAMLDEMKDDIVAGECGKKSYYFGFRRCGVDGEIFLACRSEYEYYAIYKLEVTIHEDSLLMELYRY